MSDLRESEIFDRLAQSFGAAADHCEALAQQQHRIKGQRYNKLRNELQLLEGACRQAAMWRGDWRWLPIGQYAAECHKRVGDWLRHRRGAELFLKLAQNMRDAKLGALKMKDQATGVRGPILPERPKYEPVNRMVQVSAGGIIIPPGATLQ